MINEKDCTTSLLASHGRSSFARYLFFAGERKKRIIALDFYHSLFFIPTLILILPRGMKKGAGGCCQHGSSRMIIIYFRYGTLPYYYCMVL